MEMEMQSESSRVHLAAFQERNHLRWDCVVIQEAPQASIEHTRGRQVVTSTSLAIPDRQAELFLDLLI